MLSSFPSSIKPLRLPISQALLISLISFSLPPANYHQLSVYLSPVWASASYMCTELFLRSFPVLAWYLIPQQRLIIHWVEGDVLGLRVHRAGKKVISLVEVMAQRGDKQAKQCGECYRWIQSWGDMNQNRERPATGCMGSLPSGKTYLEMLPAWMMETSSSQVALGFSLWMGIISMENPSRDGI